MTGLKFKQTPTLNWTERLRTPSSRLSECAQIGRSYYSKLNDRVILMNAGPRYLRFLTTTLIPIRSMFVFVHLIVVCGLVSYHMPVGSY